MDHDENPLIPRAEGAPGVMRRGSRSRREWKPRRSASLLVAIGAAAAALLAHFRDGQLNIGNFGFYFAMAACVGVVIYFLGHLVPTPEPEPSASPHPDPDVEAMIRGQIDAAEYAKRKAAKDPAA